MACETFYIDTVLVSQKQHTCANYHMKNSADYMFTRILLPLGMLFKFLLEKQDFQIFNYLTVSKVDPKCTDTKSQDLLNLIVTDNRREVYLHQFRNITYLKYALVHHADIIVQVERSWSSMCSIVVNQNTHLEFPGYNKSRETCFNGRGQLVRSSCYVHGFFSSISWIQAESWCRCVKYTLFLS